MKPRRIAHLDMDAFYASVELLRRPELRGLPLVIGGRRHAPRADGSPARLSDYAGRGVITTCTYEARAFGVRSGMGLMKAAALCPEAILLPVDFDEYRRLSRLFKVALRNLSPVMEDRGIDEVYLDLSDIDAAPYGGERGLAQTLKDAVRDATGLSCSIAIAPNKLLAKIGSDLDKPDGLTLLDADDIATRIWPLPVGKINGIGPKTNTKLAALGIASIGELATRDPAWLATQFGPTSGHWMHAVANGFDERPVTTDSEPKSLSRETTFERDLHPQYDRARLTPLLEELCTRLAGDLQRKGYSGRTIGIKLRDHDFVTVTRDHSLSCPTQQAADILAACRESLKRLAAQGRLHKPLRLLGVRVGNLVPCAERDTAQEERLPALPLFDSVKT